jgi:hypothetical protein
MFDDATSENNHAGLPGMDSRVVQFLDILNEIDYKALILPRVEIDDITERTIRKSRTVDWDIVLPAPVVDRVLVVDPFSDAGDNLLRALKDTSLLLLFVHFVDDGEEPRL